ncbi:MAG TPA: alpha/beta fold hydrolase [Pseudonocardia sp.]
MAGDPKSGTHRGGLVAVAPIEAASGFPTELTPFHRSGDGSPLVLLHGFTMSWRAWLPVIPYLSAHHQVFATTMAGHRGGPKLLEDGQQGAAALADAVCRQLDEAGLDTVHVAGNSLGGWTALELARRGRARSVVAISPAGCWQSRRDIVSLLWKFRVGLNAVANDRLRALLMTPVGRRAWLRRVAQHPELIPAEDMAAMIDDVLGCDLIPHLLSSSRTMQPMEPLDIAQCPVRIAWAEHDRVISFRRFGRPMQDKIRGGEFIMLPKVGHVPMYDDPRLVARTILEVTRAVDESARPGIRPGRARSRRRSA